MKVLKAFFFMTAFLAVSVLHTNAEVSNNQPVPDFTLTDSNGKQHAISQYKGRLVVLEWVNHGCPFVRKHYDSGNMQSLQKVYTQKGVIWFSINSSAPGKEGYADATQANKEIADNKSSPTAVLLDPDGKVGKLYGAKTTPHMFIIDPQGVLIYQGAIDNVPSADQEDITGANNYVKAALDEVMGGAPVSTPTSKAYGCSVKY